MRRRSRFIISVFALICMLLFQTGISYAGFTDISGHWAEQTITKWVDKGLVNGYGDGTFKPDNYITRAEFVTLVNSFFNFTEKAEVNFPDVPADAWYADEFAKAGAANYMSGYEDGTARPDNPVSRQEAAVMLANILKLDITGEMEAVDNFSDAQDIPDWSKGAINALVLKAIMTGYPDSTFRPAGLLTRAEVVVMLDRAAEFSFISAINVTNGTIKITCGTEGGLTADDFNVSAKLNGNTYELKNLRFNAENNTFTFTPVDRTSSNQTLEITVSAASGSTKVNGSAIGNITIDRYSSSGGGGGGRSTPPPAHVNTAPSTPVITKVPASGTVSVNDAVYITAYSSDAEGDAINYIWTGRLAETSQYPAGRHVITVKAVDEHGLESQPAAIMFFAIDSTTGSGGMMLTDPESRIYENGIDGATITSYTFNVPSVSGHYGDDYAFVNGLNINTGEWEQLEYVTTSNGVYMSKSLTPGVYSRLEFFYYASHCMYNKSNITYTVEFAFGNIPPGIPAEAAPTAAGVAITGNPIVGDTLEGDYTYADANGDLEGQSTFQWYRADDAAGTNKTAIAGETDIEYTLTTDDDNKYIFFEVIPVALTGVTGTITGTAVQSPPILVNAAPTASNVVITGTAEVGGILEATYTYADVNGDLEGASTFQWYRADDAAGTNKTAIAGATDSEYTLTADDAGKYIFLEVTPAALTGTITSAPVSGGPTAQVIVLPE